MRDLRGAPVEIQLRVRYAETDAMGVVHHANYFVWFEVGRTEYTRACGLPYREVEAGGVRLVVVEATARYHAPARYDDVVVVRTGLDAMSRATLTFAYEVRRSDGALLAAGHTVHAATDARGRVRRIPEAVRAALGGGGRKARTQHE
ncbi:MAG TPA: thioesterase family protein [bacterium]|nr:thioesterase family protein [bacterium]